MTTDTIEQALYQDRIRAIRDYESNIVEAFEDGENKGLRKGELRGKRKGAIQNQLNNIELGLRNKFGEAGLALMPAIKNIRNFAKLQELYLGLWTNNTLDEFRTHLPKE